jgi:sigma-B regulation protein RsbU (phosphoserine phosphatase)
LNLSFSQRYLFSDGMYELTKLEGTILSLDELVEHLALLTQLRASGPDSTIAFAECIQQSKTFTDDLSLVEVTFPLGSGEG